MNKSPAFVARWFKERDDTAERSWSGIALDGNSQHGTAWLPSDAEFLDDLQTQRSSVALSIFVQPRIQPFPQMPSSQKGDIAGGIVDPSHTVCYRAVMTVGFDVPFHDQIKAEFETKELAIAHTVANQVSRAFGREISSHDSKSLDTLNAHLMVACVGVLELPSYEGIGTSFAFEIWVQVPEFDFQNLVATYGDSLKSHVKRKKLYQEIQTDAELCISALMAKFTTPKGDSNEPH